MTTWAVLPHWVKYFLLGPAMVFMLLTCAACQFAHEPCFEECLLRGRDISDIFLFRLVTVPSSFVAVAGAA